MRGRLLELLLVLLIWGLLVAFIIYDTPRIPEIVESPSYCHWLDEHYPLEDTAHYLPCPTASAEP